MNEFEARNINNLLIWFFLNAAFGMSSRLALDFCPFLSFYLQFPN